MKKLLLFTLIYFIAGCEEKKQSQPEMKIDKEKLLTYKETKVLIDNYDKRLNLILEKEGIKDANSAWYSIEELEAYIAYAKKQGKTNNIDVSGIRFYLGIYPKGDKRFEGREGLTAIFLVPTTGGSNNRNATGASNKSTNSKSRDDQNANNSDAKDDPKNVTQVEAMDFSGIGHPPKVEYE